jgi:hypothetical protein
MREKTKLNQPNQTSQNQIKPTNQAKNRHHQQKQPKQTNQ